MMYSKYYNRQHDYRGTNCISIIAEFYENELGISLSEEKEIFHNLQGSSIRDLRKIPIETIFSLKNWIKISLTDLREFDIIVYTRNNKLSHFSMYVGDYKILDIVEGMKSGLRHLNDSTRNNIEGAIRHRKLAS